MANDAYFIYIGDKDFKVLGTTVAWDAYERAVNFADLTGERVALVDGETGEVLVDSWDEE
jgi:hypothetical protein